MCITPNGVGSLSKDYHITHEELFAFQAGRVLGTAEMYDAVWREKELEKQDRKELPKDSAQYQVLKLICGEPGLSAEELAARLPVGEEVPALSRMLRRLEDGDYIMSIRRGRHKQYYATPRGERQMPEFPEKEIRQAKEQQAAAVMPFISELKISKQKDIWMLEEANNVVNEISPNSAKIIKLESAAERQMESRALYRNTVEPERMYYEM